MVLYCRYDPDDYHGYLRYTFQAPDIEEARRLAVEEVKRRMFHVKLPLEYHVYEINYDDSPRLIER